MASILYKTRTGKIEHFRTQGLLEKYGFETGDRVSTPRGEAWVIGERDGHLYFHVDGEPGASVWKNHSKEEFDEHNFVLIFRIKSNQYCAPEFSKLFDRRFSDEILICTDGKEIPIVRAILEVRSEQMAEVLQELEAKRNANGNILVPYTHSQIYPVIYLLTVGDLCINEEDCFETLSILHDLKIQTLPLDSLNHVINESNVVELMQKFRQPELPWEKCLSKLCIQFLISHIGQNPRLQEHYKETFGDMMLQVILQATRCPETIVNDRDEDDTSSLMVVNLK